MTKPIYALTPDELRAKAREREKLCDAARADGRAEDAARADWMRRAYLARVGQIRRKEASECTTTPPQ